MATTVSYNDSGSISGGCAGYPATNSFYVQTVEIAKQCLQCKRCEQCCSCEKCPCCSKVFGRTYPSPFPQWTYTNANNVTTGGSGCVTTVAY